MFRGVDLGAPTFSPPVAMLLEALTQMSVAPSMLDSTVRATIRLFNLVDLVSTDGRALHWGLVSEPTLKWGMLDEWLFVKTRDGVRESSFR